MNAKNDQAFWDFLHVLKTAFEQSTQSALAFWLGVWHGEAARARAVKPDDPNPAPESLAFELGVQLKPMWDEIDRQIKAALLKAAVSAILGSVDVKR